MLLWCHYWKQNTICTCSTLRVSLDRKNCFVGRCTNDIIFQLLFCFEPPSCDSVRPLEVPFVHLNVRAEKVSDSSRDRTHHQRGPNLRRRGKSRNRLSCRPGNGVRSSSETRLRSMEPREPFKNFTSSLFRSAKVSIWTKFHRRKLFFKS